MPQSTQQSGSRFDETGDYFFFNFKVFFIEKKKIFIIFLPFLRISLSLDVVVDFLLYMCYYSYFFRLG